MERIITFIRRNYIALLIGVVFYAVFVHFTYSGNRICDCETTEKYNPGTSRGHSTVNRFYHK
jgi:hypothetical protein